MALGATRMITVVQEVKQEQKACPTCGVHFWAIPARRYCSRACQNKAYWQRHAEVIKQRRRKTARPDSRNPTTKEQSDI